MIRKIKQFFTPSTNKTPEDPKLRRDDKSKHRKHTTNYEDLCQ